MKITLAQLNATVGDIQGNFEKLSEVLFQSARASDLVVFPELYLTGYPPRDLLEIKSFLSFCDGAVDGVSELSRKYPETGIIVGAPVAEGKGESRRIFNGALFFHNGELRYTHRKMLLPAYDVFDETRYFKTGDKADVIEFKGEKLGLTICEDMWTGEKNGASSGYETDPVAELCEKGATVMINISASPFSAGKDRLRYEIIRSHAKRCAIPFLFVNQTGANDELIFDGRSMALDAEGRPLAVLPAFKESIETIEVPSKPIADTYAPMDETASVHEALVTGLRDYMHKNSFKKAVLGLSGGIDSAVTAAIACEAAGKGNILGVSMPSAFSSDESLEYSRMLADNLGMDFKNIPISEVYDVYLKVLVGNGLVERGDEVSVTLQNIQSRIRGNILMAYSNESGYLLLSTGNKSEMAVGYCTLYGDMAGGLAVLSDVPKTMVYSLADHINRETEIIPQEIVDRAPTAELRPGQLDSQALPPYPVLDRILYLYIHEKLAAGDIAAEGFGRETVDWVIKSVNRNEYKRRQAPPGLKVTSKAFGSGRRMPVSAKFIWE